MSIEILKRIISSIILIPIVLTIIIKGGLIFNILIFIIFIISIYEWNKMSLSKFYILCGFFFIFFSFISIYQIRNIGNDNYLYLLFILTICVSTDIGGFVFGKIIKGPKLTKISPNKTYAGVIGSYILSLISVYFFVKFYSVNFTYLEIIIFTLVISSISQLGDILISFFKRLTNIKDTGNIIPGHGGILDRIDGMIFAFPFSYILFQFNLFKI